MKLVLASGSAVRRSILENAGLRIEVAPAALDERAAEEPLLKAGVASDDLALALAMAKATLVSEGRASDLVIGADQVLELDGERFTKPSDMEAARRQLLGLSGRTHQLHTAVCCARSGEITWQHVETVRMKMRRLTPEFIGRYLARAGEDVLASVGAYQVEGLGIQLFEEIDGDYFAILGLPLLPLLKYLRREGIVE